MTQKLINLISSLGFEANAIAIGVAVLLIIALFALIIHLVAHKIIYKIIQKADNLHSTLISKMLVEQGFFKRAVMLVQGVVVYYQANIWLQETIFFEAVTALSLVWVAIFGLLVAYSLIDRLSELFFAPTDPSYLAVKTLLQSIKIVFAIVTIIYILSVLVGKSPIAILSALGAMSAVLMLVFKDTILGFSAGIQLSSNKMVQIGDWIEMPKYGADGDVIDIGLNVVKVRNWDKTITTIPTYALVSDSFKNWQGMREAGGRRIKRSILLDVKSIKFLSDEDIERLKKANLLAPYFDSKLKEIAEYNEKGDFDLSVAMNGRRLTNLGTYRAYINTYINTHPRINNKNFLAMVRQLTPSEHGMPLEVYCFTNTTAWVDYENIQSDIFDHAYSILSEFGLKPYQMR